MASLVDVSGTGLGCGACRDVLRAGGVNLLWGLLLAVSDWSCPSGHRGSLCCATEEDAQFRADRRAVAACLCWALQDVNAAIVATNAGTRLTLGELDADGVEAWVDHKKAQVREAGSTLQRTGTHHQSVTKRRSSLLQCLGC